MKRALLLVIILILVSSPLLAAEANTKVLETKGQGVNRDEAINQALKQAVAQARGVAVSSIDTNFLYRSASADIERTDTGKRVEFDAVGVQTGGTTLRTDMAGLIKTYEVLSEKILKNGLYEVMLKVWVYDYESPEKSDRLRLAVMPIRTLAPSYTFGNLTVPSFDVSRQFSQRLASALTQTNKFAVLDREYIQEFARERNILLSDSTSLDELSRLGEVLGVDYMLVGTITDAGIRRDQQFSPAIGRPTSEYEADFTFEYRLIVGPTRQIKLAGVLDISLDKTEQIKKLVKKWEPQDMDWREMTDNFITMAANQLVETVIDQIYPVRIAGITGDGQIIINQGGSRISAGQLFDIYSQGKELFDVDTHESLGTTETLVATIKVEKVLPRMSYAKLINGSIAQLSEGLICRPRKAEQAPLEGRKGNIPRSPQGGVKLPFD